MKKMKKNTIKKFLLVLFPLVIALILLGILFANPLRRSPEELRQKILKTTPYGTSLEDVEKIAHGRGYAVSVSREAGFLKQEGSVQKTVGVQSIRAEAGDYWSFPYMVSVSIFWGFDKNGKLVDVWVWKVHEGL